MIELQPYRESTTRQKLAAGRILKFNTLFFEPLAVIQEDLANWNSFLLVEKRNTIAAATMKMYRPGYVSLEYLAVKQSRQDQGLGRKMMGLLEQVAIRENPEENRVLISLVPMTGSEEFYKKIGYSTDQTKPGQLTKLITPETILPQAEIFNRQNGAA